MVKLQTQIELKVLKVQFREEMTHEKSHFLNLSQIQL